MGCSNSGRRECFKYQKLITKVIPKINNILRTVKKGSIFGVKIRPPKLETPIDEIESKIIQENMIPKKDPIKL